MFVLGLLFSLNQVIATAEQSFLFSSQFGRFYLLSERFKSTSRMNYPKHFTDIY